MPLTTGDQFADALRQIDTNSPEVVRNVAGLGRVLVSKQVQATQRVDEVVSENTVGKPKPPEGKDNSTAIILDATDITTTSLLAKCDIKDIDGATGICTLKKADGTVVSTWDIGVDKAITGLTPNTAYTLDVVGTAKNGSNGVTNPINRSKNVQTNAEAWVTPTLPATLPAINVGDGA